MRHGAQHRCGWRLAAPHGGGSQADRAFAETLHSMNGTTKAFRLIVVKHKHQTDLFDDDAPRYHVIASNRVESTEATLIWYRQRGNATRSLPCASVCSICRAR